MIQEYVNLGRKLIKLSFYKTSSSEDVELVLQSNKDSIDKNDLEVTAKYTLSEIKILRDEYNKSSENLTGQEFRQILKVINNTENKITTQTISDYFG